MKQDKQRIIVTHVLKNPKVKDKNIWIQLPYLGIIVNKDKELKYVISENLNKICKEKFIKQKILSKDNYKKLIIPFAIDVQKETVYLCPIGYICHGVKRNVCKIRLYKAY